MGFKEMSWTGIVSCFCLYCVVFLAVRYQTGIESPSHSQARLGLLIFAVPGVVAALTSRESPLTVAILGALLATPFCLLLLQLRIFSGCAVFQEVAFATSAVFWCGSGALLVLLCRILFWH